MAAGYVPNSPLSTLYSNTTAGTPASPDAVDGAIQAIVAVVNENYDAAQAVNNGLSGHKSAAVLDHPDQSVTTVKLKDLNVTTSKLADGAVTTAKQADLSVTRAKIALGAVGGAQLDPTLFQDLSDIEVQARFEQVDAQLVQLKISLGSVPFGKVTMPQGFAALPCNFVRRHDGKIYNDFNFSPYKTGTVIYCDVATGNDTTGNGSVGTPYKTLNKATQVAADGADGAYLIKCKSVRFDRSFAQIERTYTGKTIAIVPDNAENKVIITSHSTGLSWTADGAGTWKATRSGVYSVFDLRYIDDYAVPIPFENKGTLAECQAAPYSWYTDNATVWIHTGDGLVPTDANIVVNVSNPLFEVTLLGGSKLYLENVMVLHGRSTQSCRVFGDLTGATVTGEFVTNGCKFAGGDLRKTRDNAVNAISVVSVKNTYHFNTIAAYGGEDGFNYHYEAVPTAQKRSCLAIEYNCASYENGKFSSTNTSNCTTSHDSANILRIGTIGYSSKGPICADVNGCYSVMIDCHMRDSLASIASQKAAYQFNQDGTTGGKAVLINCDGGGDDTYSVNSNDNLDITLQSFRGFNFPVGFTATIKS